VVGLVVAGALLAATFLAIRPGDDQAAKDPAKQPPATKAQLEHSVAQISRFVERERGLRFKKPVRVQLLGEGAFQRRLLVDFDKDAAENRKDEVMLKGLGLVPPGDDMVGALRSLLGAGVVGFYDPETKALVVRGAALTPYVRTTIAHELTHALDDQWFDLDRPQYDHAADEVSFGFSALAEGDARRVEDAYRSSLSTADQQAAAVEELQIGAKVDVGAVPPVLVDMVGAPYTDGEVFVEDLVAQGGNHALAGAFASPPRTSEQVLDPDAYLAHQGPVPVPHPQVAGPVVKQGLAGRLLITELLTPALGNRSAVDAATGWGGDWAVAWRDHGRPCTTLTVVGDNATETAHLLSGFRQWATTQPGATVTSAGPGAPMTVASCAAASGAA